MNAAISASLLRRPRGPFRSRGTGEVAAPRMRRANRIARIRGWMSSSTLSSAGSIAGAACGSLLSSVMLPRLFGYRDTGLIANRGRSAAGSGRGRAAGWNTNCTSGRSRCGSVFGTPPIRKRCGRRGPCGRTGTAGRPTPPRQGARRDPVKVGSEVCIEHGQARWSCRLRPTPGRSCTGRMAGSWACSSAAGPDPRTAAGSGVTGCCRR